MTNVQVFRPWTGIAVAIFVLLLCAALTATDWRNPLGWLWSLAVCSATWLVFVRPKLIISDEGVVVINPTDASAIAWQDLSAVEVKYAVTFMTPEFKVASWVATGPGRYHARTVHRTELLGIGIPKRDLEAGLLRPGESPRTASGQALALCRLRMAHHAELSAAGKAPAKLDTARRFNLIGVGFFLSAMLAASIASIVL